MEENYLESKDSDIKDVDKEIYQIENPGAKDNVEELDPMFATYV